MNGFPKLVRDVVYARADGRCERCDRVSFAYEWHHRRPRAMGGSKADDTNVASNCLLLCGVCHRVVEQHRHISLDRGYIVSQGDNPAAVKVWRFDGWVYLTDDGTVVTA